MGSRERWVIAALALRSAGAEKTPSIRSCSTRPTRSRAQQYAACDQHLSKLLWTECRWSAAVSFRRWKRPRSATWYFPPLRDLDTMCRDTWGWQSRNPRGYKKLNEQV